MTVDNASPDPQNGKDFAPRGLHQKYHVERTDGSPKHDGCRYFVLDLDHDVTARSALRHYADAIRMTNTKLAADIWRLLGEVEHG